MAPLTVEAPIPPLEEITRQADGARAVERDTMRILVAGARGMIGSAVAPSLAKQGHTVVRLVRRAPARPSWTGTARAGDDDAPAAPGEGEVRWDPDRGTIDRGGLEGFKGVVHVASLPQARWTPAFIKRWRENHVGTNRLLAETLANCERRPRVLVCASAQGIYAPSDEQVLTEDSSIGADFLAQLLHEGEQATAPASEAGIRVVHLRLPTVLGGATLGSMFMHLRRLGSGRQWFSWVARDEVASIVHHALVTDALDGPVNATSPNPVRNAEFFATLGRVLGRQPFVPMPAFLLQLILGQMADALILASRRIEPGRLLATGYAFRFPELEVALRRELDMIGAARTR
jgi:uncharacterized protein (TIGR01777 family)